MSRSAYGKPATDELNASNYQDFARRAIDKYHEKGMMVDALLWSKIIGYYNTEISKAQTDAGEAMQERDKLLAERGRGTGYRGLVVEHDELLAACKRLTKFVETIPQGHSQERVLCVNEAQAAIARAEGSKQ
jgi:hypothetical protein